MTDVARVAGVSQSSVSLVLNEMSGARITAETQQRVREAAHKIGYRLPSVRRDFTEAPDIEKDTIAFIIDEISTSPHPVVSLDGIRDYAFEQGLMVSAHVTRSNPDLQEAVMRSVLRDKSVMGVIYATIFTRKVFVPPQLKGIPTVLLNCYAEPRQHMAIVPGEVAGGFAATAHLTALGHKRIGFINGEPWMDAAVDRLKGYKQALATADIAFDESLVRDGDWLPLRGYEAGLELLSLTNPPTAIFCGNDLMAIGVMEAAAELGLRVPDDLSVMGYDDQELARYTHPPLSTLVLPNYEMGQRAAEILIDMAVHQKPLRPMTIKVDGPIVLRGSVAPAASR
nr:LacI family DNA-binding transcriptional regulator [Pararhizobium antarcticum]